MFDKFYLLDIRIHIGKFIYSIIDKRADKSLNLSGNEFVKYRWFNCISNKEIGFEIERISAQKATKKLFIRNEANETFAWYYSINYIFMLIKHIFLK